MLNPIIPFEPTVAKALPDGATWIAQVKWDGVRVLTYLDGQGTRLFNRRLHERTAQFPELVQTQSYCVADSVILDGEVIAMQDGKPSFHTVMRRDAPRKSGSIKQAVQQVGIQYMVFDVLFWNGAWVTDKPLRDRQWILEKILRPSPVVYAVESTDNVEGLANVTLTHGLEGIVIKDLNSPYRVGGKDERWQKWKHDLDEYAVVGGVTYRDGIVNAVLLGMYDQSGGLVYVGHAGTGKLTQENWKDLTKAVDPLKRPTMPFATTPERRLGVSWIEPQLVARVKFAGWTPTGSMRQPSIQTFLSKPPTDCRLPDGWPTP